MDKKTRSRVFTGLTFILLGLGLFGLQYFGPLGQSAILLTLGGLALAGYLFTRAYLLLVAGGILLGLGVGSFGERHFSVWGEFSKIGLGAGFILIYLVQLLYERCSHWWPLIPGTILILLGLGRWHDAWTYLVSDGWPLILVLIGVLVLLGALGRKRKAPRAQPGKD
jgi:hypothetical protein